MNSILKMLNQRFIKLKMKDKMRFSFAMPVMIVTIIMIIFEGVYFIRVFGVQLTGNINRSQSLVRTVVENYLKSMDYIAAQIVGSEKINEIISRENFGTSTNPDEIYREFFDLKEVFTELEMKNSEYHIGMYIDDSLAYSNNKYYFYPMSELEAMDDYGDIMNSIDFGVPYYSMLSEMANSGNSRAEVRYLTMLVPLENDSGFIAKVQVKEDTLEDVLDNARITDGTLAYLVDGSGRIMTTSNLDISFAELDNQHFDKKDNWVKCEFNGKDYYRVFSSIDVYGWQIVSLIPVSEYLMQYMHILLWITLVIVVTIFVVGFVASRLSIYYVGKIDKVNDTMNDIRQGNVNSRIHLKYQDGESNDEMDVLYQNFDYMIDEIQRLMKEEYRLGKSISRAEMRTLQAQINPHFLYNTLDLINWGAMDYGADNVAKIARDLGQYYRLSLNHGKSIISIGDEIKHVKAYIDIENVHFEGKINLNVNIADEISDYACVNTILQPIVENSIVHGIAEKTDIESCTIDISAEIDGDDIIIKVEDDGPGMDEETRIKILEHDVSAKDHGFGIGNTNFRIKLCYGEKYGITYEDKKPHGTVAVVRIKALKADELEKIMM
ncbi:MAG: histidine kinase [Butyrivibrio sp.]|nr:histidine kinase [Butyrivibrio sp.]